MSKPAVKNPSPKEIRFAGEYLRGKVLPQLFGEKCVECVNACLSNKGTRYWPTGLARSGLMNEDLIATGMDDPYFKLVVAKFEEEMLEHHVRLGNEELARMFAHQFLIGVPALSDSGVAKNCNKCSKACISKAGSIAKKVYLSASFGNQEGVALPTFNDVFFLGGEAMLGEFDNTILLAHAQHGSRVVNLRNEEEY
jgi:hypothetical protein